MVIKYYIFLIYFLGLFYGVPRMAQRRHLQFEYPSSNVKNITVTLPFPFHCYQPISVAAPWKSENYTHLEVRKNELPTAVFSFSLRRRFCKTARKRGDFSANLSCTPNDVLSGVFHGAAPVGNDLSAGLGVNAVGPAPPRGKSHLSEDWEAAGCGVGRC